MDTSLDSTTWESRHFQFYAGDLYDAIPGLQKKYYPDQKLNGECKALLNGFSLARGGTDFLNVTVNFECYLNGHGADRIVDIILNTSMSVTGVTKANYTDFNIKSMEYTAMYYPSQAYPIENKELVDYYMNSTIHSMRGSRVFGSGFPSQFRDYPHFEVTTDYVFIYDSSSVHESIN